MTAPLFGMLGPLEVDGKERPPSFGGPKQRAVFLDLLVHANEVMLPSTLIEDVWEGQPPAGASTTVKVYLSHLRQALTEVLVDGRPPALLSSRRPGYVLELEPDLIDARRFERWVAEAGRLLPADPDQATPLLVAALGLWRGPALAEVADLSFARPEVTGLEQLRLTALGWRIEADLGRGRHGELIGELKTLVEAYPLHEGFWAQLMRALHSAGRRAEALRVYRTARQVLGEELGIDPSLALQELERVILLQEPDQDDSAPAGAHPRSNLPVAATSFVGRSAELAELAVHLDEHRLVTVVGEGGSGKTRLGIEAASRLALGVDRGPWLVELAPATNADQALRLLAQVTGARDHDGAGLMEAVIEALGDSNALIVLDNCEHLVDSLAGMVEDLMRGCPNIRILATSREGLDVGGETLWRIPTLATPPEDLVLGASAALRYDGVRLLVERATSADPNFRLTDDRVAAVSTICRRLDGMPLALELAAARLRVLSLEDVAARLDDRFRLLGQANRTAVPRQRSLQAALDWSYDLLMAHERLLFGRLSVFAGIFSLEHVEAVCSGDGVAGDDAVDLLGNLVAKSLVVRVPRSNGPARFRLLETVRHYAASRLAEGSDADRLRSKHAAWFTGRSEELSANRFGAGRRRWLERLGEEHDDCRAALGWLIEQGDRELALRMATALWRFWDYNYLTAEGRSWLDRALAMPGGDPSLRRRALAGSAHLTWMEDNLDGAEVRCEQGLALPFGSEDPAGRAALLALQGEIARHRGGQPERAERLCREAVGLFHRAGDDWGEADAQKVLALLATEAGNLVSARQLGEGCLRLWERCGDVERSAGAKLLLALVARDGGDLEQAEALCEQSLVQFRQAEEPWGTAQIVHNLGIVVLTRGDYARAHRLGEEGLAINQQLGNRRGIARALKLMGDAALQLGHLDEADRRCQEALDRFRARGFAPDILTAERSAAAVALVRGDLDGAALLLDGEVAADSADLILLGLTRVRQGRVEEAVVSLERAAEQARSAGDDRTEAAVLEARAEAAIAAGAPEMAARWLREAAAKRHAAGVVLTPTEAADHRRSVAALGLLDPSSPHVVAGEELAIDLRDVPSAEPRSTDRTGPAPIASRSGPFSTRE